MEVTHFDSVQGTTTKLCLESTARRSDTEMDKMCDFPTGCTGIWPSFVLLVACVALWLHCAPRALNPAIFLCNHRKKYMRTAPRTFIFRASASEVLSSCSQLQDILPGLHRERLLAHPEQRRKSFVADLLGELHFSNGEYTFDPLNSCERRP